MNEASQETNRGRRQHRRQAREGGITGDKLGKEASQETSRGRRQHRR